MHILGRDLKKIIKEEIGREMRQHASGEIQAEAEIHEEITPERDAYLKKTSPVWRTMMDPEMTSKIMADMNAEDSEFEDALADMHFSQKPLPRETGSGLRTASTQPVMDFGTTEFSSDNIRDIEDNLPEGENITDRLMEKWLR